MIKRKSEFRKSENVWTVRLIKRGEKGDLCGKML
jgi:hypothetical protein